MIYSRKGKSSRNEEIRKTSLRGRKVFVLSFLLYLSLSRFGTLLCNMMELAYYGYLKNTFF